MSAHARRCRVSALTTFIVAFAAGLFIPAPFISSEGFSGATAAESGKESSRPLALLIRKVQENEALFSNAEIKFKRTYQPWDRNGEINWSVNRVDETVHWIRTDERFLLQHEELAHWISGKTSAETRTVVFNGESTVDYYAGNSVSHREGPHEPYLMLSPHTWPAWSVGLRIPLSVLLGGTEAIQQHPRGRRPRGPKGGIYQFAKVEVEYFGNEQWDGLACEKVLVKRWYAETGEPQRLYLWLARDRNYHCVRRITVLSPDSTRPVSEDRVFTWRQLSDAVWIPEHVESRTSTGDGEDEYHVTHTLDLQVASLTPNASESTFSHPTIPLDLPRFEFAADGSLLRSPTSPEPVASEDETTLQDILLRLKAEEEQYETFAATINSTYRTDGYDVVGVDNFDTITESDETEFSVRMNDKGFFQESKTSRTTSGRDTQLNVTYACDGKTCRELTEITSKGEQTQTNTYGAIKLLGVEGVPVIAPHTVLLRTDKKPLSLHHYLTSGWYDEYNKYGMTVEYIGDEMVDGLICHRIRCAVVIEGRTPEMNSWFDLWLAKDRNLLPIRREWRSPSRTDRLPTSISWVSKFEKLSPGRWVPAAWTLLAFDGDELQGDRLIVSYRTDSVMKDVTLTPELPSEQFDSLSFPAETKIAVYDSDRSYLGRIEQVAAGNPTFSDEQLLAMRLEAAQRQKRNDDRENALQALIGQTPPPLPVSEESWLNSEPMTWESLKGKVVLIDFWANWCGPCVPSLAKLADVHTKWKKQDSEDRIIIGLHPAGSEKQAVIDAAGKHDLKYPICIDAPPENSTPAWGNLYGKFAVSMIPYAIVIGTDGKIAAHGHVDDMLLLVPHLINESRKQEE